MAGRVVIGGHLPQLSFDVVLLRRAVVQHEFEEVGRRQELVESRVRYWLVLGSATTEASRVGVPPLCLLLAPAHIATPRIPRQIIFDDCNIRSSQPLEIYYFQQHGIFQTFIHF